MEYKLIIFERQSFWTALENIVYSSSQCFHISANWKHKKKKKGKNKAYTKVSCPDSNIKFIPLNLSVKLFTWIFCFWLYLKSLRLQRRVKKAHCTTNEFYLPSLGNSIPLGTKGKQLMLWSTQFKYTITNVNKTRALILKNSL